MIRSYLGLALSGLLLAACNSEADQAAPEAADTNLAQTPAATASPAMADGVEDVLVPGTDFNATTTISCGFAGKLDQQCPAGVKRNWGDEPGGAMIEVTKPDGRTRAIFFRGTEAYGADSSQADGSAAWSVEVDRKDDMSTISFGPERYEVVDAFIVGG